VTLASTAQKESGIRLRRLRFPRAWPFLLYFAAVLLAFFRTDLFFQLDDYAGLWRLAQAPSLLQFIAAPHNEHFIPLFHLFWALEVYLFREHYLCYVLTNVALMAMMGALWESWLRRVGVQPALAVSTPLVAVTCLSQADNIMAAWQANILLCSLALVGILRAYSAGRLHYVAILCVCAPLTFSAGYILPAVMAGFLIFDFFRSGNRRLLPAAAGLLAVFGILLKLSLMPRAPIEGWHWSVGVTSGHMAALWEGPDTWHKLLHLAWLGWYTTGVAFYPSYAPTLAHV